jgi:UDP-N-acetylmuramoylalanine--D-glutamate ligase
MDSKLLAFYSYLRGRRIAMLGIGVSNTPLIKKFAEKGALVTACDKRSRTQLGSTADELEAAGAKLKLGGDYLQNLDTDFDIIFRTPGMKFTLPELEAARAAGVRVTSEMEVFFDLCPCRIIAVTGSDGKTNRNNDPK